MYFDVDTCNVFLNLSKFGTYQKSDSLFLSDIVSILSMAENYNRLNNRCLIDIEYELS